MRKHFESPLIFGLILLFCASFAHGQGFVYQGTPVVNGVGQPIAGASVAVSTSNPCGTSPSYTNCGGSPQGTYTGTTPPSNLATLYTDLTLGAITTNPLTTDAFGNWAAYLSTTGNYWITIYGSRITAQVFAFSIAPTGSVSIVAVSGETVAHAISRLPVTGGIVQLGAGIYQSGSPTISTPNVTIQGVGAPTYNSQTNPTALNSDGTVVQGPIIGIQGADGLTVRDLGADCGSAWFVANGSVLPSACVGIFNNNQTIGAPPVQNPLFSNITCLGNSASAAAHCLIQENVHKGIIENSRTFFMTHGMVQKGYDNYMSNVTAQGHASDCFIFKSDVYAPGGRWKLKNFSCNYGTVLGDSQGIVVQANNGGNVQYVEISNGEITGQTGRGILLWGNDNADQLLQVLISNVNFDSQNASAYCLINQGYLSDVTMTGFHCFNSASGGIANLSIGTQNDFNYSNGIIANITGNGIDTIGRTHVSGVDFVNITGNAIQTENSGITYECNNSFASIGGSTLAAVGSGSYRWCNNSSTEDLSGDISFPAGLGPGKSAIAAFPACTSSLEGQHLIATTCNAGCSAGGTCTTGGTTHCEMYCNSSPAWVETGR